MYLPVLTNQLPVLSHVLTCLGQSTASLMRYAISIMSKVILTKNWKQSAAVRWMCFIVEICVIHCGVICVIHSWMICVIHSGVSWVIHIPRDDLCDSSFDYLYGMICVILLGVIYMFNHGVICVIHRRWLILCDNSWVICVILRGVICVIHHGMICVSHRGPHDVGWFV